jgi:hypothetical protein
MNGNGYKLLGYVVWRGRKWFLRRLVRSVRKVELAVGVGVLTALVAAVLARRVAS